MNDVHQTRLLNRCEEDIDREISLLLRQTKKSPPMGFALRATLKYQERISARHFRRMIFLTVLALGLTSAALWIFIFNFGSVAHGVLDSFKTATSLIGSVMMFWECAPVLCGVLTCILFGFSVINFGMLAKLTKHRILVK